MFGSNALECKRIRLVRLDVALHPLAVGGYGQWSAMPRALAVGDLPSAELAAMFALRPLVAVRNGSALQVVGGFAGYRIFVQLELQQSRPVQAHVMFMENAPELIANIVEAELLLALGEYGTGDTGAALTQYVEALPLPLRADLLGGARVSKQSLARITNQNRRKIERPRQMRGPEDSDILKALLAKI